MSAASTSGLLSPATIRSRPVYSGLHPVLTARRNLVAVEGAGRDAAARLLAGAPEAFAARTHLLCTKPAVEEPRLAAAHRLEAFGGPDELLDALGRLLVRATMGTRLYAAGSEGFVGRVIRTGVEHGIDHRSVLTEHAGSLARRVQCVHCKHVGEQVTVSHFECEGCGRLLFVRDHYSRRLAAFQGVCVNAEDPTERPVPEVAYP